jgi:hypothetical protein
MIVFVVKGPADAIAATVHFVGSRPENFQHVAVQWPDPAGFIPVKPYRQLQKVLLFRTVCVYDF